MLVRNLFLGVICGGLIAGCSCSSDGSNRKHDKKSDHEVAFLDENNKTYQIVEAMAAIHPVGDSKVKGTVTFTEVKGGTKVVADIFNLTPGKHGFHIHEHGDCGGEGADHVGSHYNPTNKKHGSPDSDERHVGDLGNIIADDKGHAHFERTDKIISLRGENSIVGRSIVVHAGEDDLTTQPTGNSGAKVGCGIIKGIAPK